MIDAHVHLWELARRHDAWPGPELPALHRDFGIDDLRAALVGSGVRQVLLIQSEPSEADTLWLMQMAGDPIVAGVVGWTDLAAADAPARIDALAAAGPLVGIRPMVQDLADEWYDDVALDAALAHLAHRGLVLDALVRPRHLASLARLAARHPVLRIVIDHAAKPPIGGDTTAWAEEMRALAALPNVTCKLSGLLTEVHRGQHADAVPRIIADLLAMFGPDRLIWGSDWPVVTTRSSYADWLAQARAAIPSCLHGAVFGGNAARVYRTRAGADAASRVTLPRYGMGTAAIGNLYRAIDDEQAYVTIAAALAGGIGYFDTAPHYGHGLAERRLGDALAALDPGVTATVSTKVGRLLVPTTARGERHGFVDADPFEPVFDYSADGIRRSLDASRARLRRDRVDMLLAHDLGAATHGDDHPRHLRDFLDGGYAAMVALRDAGEVGAIGIGVNEIAICETLLDRVDLDVILLAGRYTLLDRSAAALLDRCRDRGVRVIVGGPYNSGILARDPAEADPALAHYDYAAPSADLVNRTRALASDSARFGVALPAAALQFPLRHPAVACVIAGLVGEPQVNDMVARAATAIPKDYWMALGADDRPQAHRAPSEQLILLRPDDNVLICVSPIAAGDILTVSGGTIPSLEGITVGHKVARRPLRAGDKVIKYGAPIGSMTADARAGDWVHTHNMKSDYIASHTRSTVSEAQS